MQAQRLARKSLKPSRGADNQEIDANEDPDREFRDGQSEEDQAADDKPGKKGKAKGKGRGKGRGRGRGKGKGKGKSEANKGKEQEERNDSQDNAKTEEQHKDEEEHKDENKPNNTAALETEPAEPPEKPKRKRKEKDAEAKKKVGTMETKRVKGSPTPEQRSAASEAAPDVSNKRKRDEKDDGKTLPDREALSGGMH